MDPASPLDPRAPSTPPPQGRVEDRSPQLGPGPGEPEATRARWWLVALPYLAIACFVTLRVWVDFAEPQRKAPEWVTNIYADRWALYRVMAYTCLPLALLAAARLHAGTRRWLASAWGRRATAALLGAAVLFTGLNYTYFARILRQPGWVQTHDSFHYTLGAKYYAELGYTEFYDCVLLTKVGRRMPAKARIRDLEDYTFGRVRQARQRLAKDDTCRPRFSEARWAAFEADIEGLFRRANKPSRINSRTLGDKGYNGTPLHAFVMGKLGQAVGTLDIVTVARMSLIDVWGICAIGFFLCLAFGWRVGMLSSAYYFVAAADRFDMIGGSPSRYYWVILLALAVAALARERWARAGVGLTVSTALVAFPVFFWLGAAASFVGEFLRGRSASGKRFLASCVIAGVVCLGLGAAHGDGVRNYTNWVDDMRIHSVDFKPRDLEPGPLTATPGFGLGLKFAMMHSVREDDRRTRADRVREYRRVRAPYKTLGWFLMLAALVVATRLRPAAACVLVGCLGFWALQGTVGYYFVCASLLPLLLAAGWRSGAQASAIEALAPGLSPASRDRWAPMICASLEVALWMINFHALYELAKTEDRAKMLQVDLSLGLGVWMVAALLAFAWLGRPLRSLRARA
ncbi:hypothetical protein [Enhygromyxa salina]|uniref:hypothetical protein n=1 Tax=Enhygromyxa salina TaxID=215803 RepID=UPI000D087828|nr:hypothetical protein [Enhygromyxa salina]